jgi:hypothetical protein
MQVSTRNTSTRPIIGPGRHQMPSQLHFYRPAQMSLFARVTCYPPLGQVTGIPRVQKALQSEKDDTVSYYLWFCVYLKTCGELSLPVHFPNTNQID